MQFRNLTENETSLVNAGQPASTNPVNNQGSSTGEVIKFKTLDAPHNTVFDADKNRTIALPQTLTADETSFIIKRDADEIKNIFAQEDTGGLEGLGKGVANFFMSQPQALGSLMKERAEVANQRVFSGEYLHTQPEDLAGLYGVYRQVRKLWDIGIVLGAPGMEEKGQQLIDRNKKYIAEHGFERPENQLGAVAFDIGNGGGSLLTALGIAGLTRSPATAAVYFGALQKSQIV